MASVVPITARGFHRKLPVLRVRCLTLRRLFFGMLLRNVMPDDTAADRADDGVMPRVVSRDATDHGPFDATRRVRRPADGDKKCCGGNRGLTECCHAIPRFSCSIRCCAGAVEFNSIHESIRADSVSAVYAAAQAEGATRMRVS